MLDDDPLARRFVAEASRITDPPKLVAAAKKLCVPLERQVLLSHAIATLLSGRETVPLGSHAMKDIGKPQAVFGIR